MSAEVTAVEVRGRVPRGRSFRRGAGSIIGFSGLILIVLIAIAAPWIAPYEPSAQDLSNTLAPPVWAGGDAAHLFGTDGLGRDVLSRVIFGARSSVLIGVCAMLIGAILGVLTGLTAGFLGRAVDTVLMRLGDIQLAIPFILIAIVILGMMPERRPIHLIVVMGIPAWIIYARVVRSRVLSEREQDHVRAAITLGASKPRQMFRYVLPRVWGVVPAIALVDLSNLVVMESTLSFLGFGLSSPDVSWGQILADGRQSMATSPWLTVIPGLAIMLTVLSINFVVDSPTVGARRRWFRRRDRPAQGSATAGGRRPSPAAGTSADDDVLLRVRDLAVEFETDGEAVVRAVRGVSFDVRRRQIVGIVGESGSGKSVTASAIAALLPSNGRVSGGAIEFDGVSMVDAPPAALRAVRGRRIGMIFQNPTGSLNPVLTVGYQMIEAIRTHRGGDRTGARAAAAAALKDVGFGDPAHTLRQYPFRLSGGQNQRVMIAMTMVIGPELLLADEPTTALDVTTQAQVLDQLTRVRDETGASIVLISHDIGLIGEVADEVIVMYAGEVCEHGPAERVLREPRHPYTQALLASVPRPEAVAAGELTAIPGDLPDPSRTTAGCPFADRCPQVMDTCRSVDPELREYDLGWSTACHLYDDRRVEVARS